MSGRKFFVNDGACSFETNRSNEKIDA
jgi:hypothetical protein